MTGSRSYAGSAIEVGLQPRYQRVHTYPEYPIARRATRYYPSTRGDSVYYYHVGGSGSSYGTIVVNSARSNCGSSSSVHQRKRVSSQSMYYSGSNRLSSPLATLPPMRCPTSPVMSSIGPIPSSSMSTAGRENKRFYQSTYQSLHEVPGVAIPIIHPPVPPPSPGTSYLRQLDTGRSSASSSRSSSQTSLFSQNSARSSVSSLYSTTMHCEPDYQSANVYSAEPSPNMKSLLEEASLPTISMNYTSGLRRKRSHSIMDDAAPYHGIPSVLHSGKSSGGRYGFSQNYSDDSPSALELPFTYVELSKYPTPPSSEERLGQDDDYRELSLDNRSQNDIMGAAVCFVNQLPILEQERKVMVNRVQNILCLARVNMRVVAIAIRLLECLSSGFWPVWRTEMAKNGLPTKFELVIIGTLSVAMKYEEDKSYSSSYWSRAVAHGELSTRDVTTAERLILLEIDHKIAKLARENAEIQRVCRDIKTNSQIFAQQKGNLAGQMLGFGPYEYAV